MAKKVIIIGATSGLGAELARLYLSGGYVVGVTGRREEELRRMRDSAPEMVHFRRMDVTDVPQALAALDELIGEMGGVDTIVYSAGVGTQNPLMEPQTEMASVYTNAAGFTAVAVAAYNYFKISGGGQFVVLSSLAGLRPLRQAPAYSATKRFQIHYMQCLAAKAAEEKQPITMTTIMPGFIRTPMLRRDYPFSISQEYGARLIYKAIESGRRSVILPRRWRILVTLMRLIPVWQWLKL